MREPPARCVARLMRRETAEKGVSQLESVARLMRRETAEKGVSKLESATLPKALRQELLSQKFPGKNCSRFIQVRRGIHVSVACL